FYTELIIAAIPALIEVIGAIIAAIIVARATKDSTKNGTDKTDVKKDNGKDSKPKKIIIKDSAGKEQEVVTVEDLHRVLKEIYGS
ncbi:MAG: hypothetical protein IIZ78_04590, partial [Clostridiales bacterium]|nr:hypothetical protein [Clostridiales bacterium]